MAIVEPGKGRAVIENDGAGLRITIPARTNISQTMLSIIFMPFWLFGIAVAAWKIMTEPLSFGTAFLVFWLTGWTLGGLWSFNVLLWNLAGKEIIELNSTTLKRRKQIPFFNRSRKYAVAGIKHLRRTTPRTYRYYYQQDMSFLNFNDGGVIAFDYGSDTHRLGSGLDQADADRVVKEMCKAQKSLCPPESPCEDA
jgi:hypothetical protein